ncbi:MAG: D-cysteine desulfhydrase family protein, partial [Chloroflexi bacterium]|nr:D-cysteine desulfhydrase family protein [Chloroflexota bacterium]
MNQAQPIVINLPSVDLAYLPTPLEPLPRLSAELGGPELWIKRDDLTGLATGGNKTRKLSYLIADALEQGADCVITAGSTQSNHARQTAAAARVCGLEPQLVLFSPTGQAPEDINGNLLLNQMLGATLHWTTERAPYAETIQTLAAALQKSGRHPYVIPYGGSNAIGICGYIDAMDEAAEQMADVGRFDAIVFATSSGGTQAGMLLGMNAFSQTMRPRLVGISVDEAQESLGARVSSLAQSGAELLGYAGPIEAPEINDDYLGGGYAGVGPAEREAIRLLAQTEGVLVDPVYSGRALAGLIDLIRLG